MNVLRERARSSDPEPTTALDIYDDDLEAALARYETLGTPALAALG
jgi:hypothetical protein